MLAIRVTGPVFHELTGDFAPEQLLQIAVLADAIGDLKTYSVSPGFLTYGPAKAAWRWILEDGDRRYAFSFLGVCESLGLDAAWLRTKLKDLRKPPPALATVLSFERQAVNETVLIESKLRADSPLSQGDAPLADSHELLNGLDLPRHVFNEDLAHEFQRLQISFA